MFTNHSQTARAASRLMFGRALGSALLLAGLSACGTYEPPKPGVYRGLGVADPDVQCTYETPTASTFVRMRCRRSEDMKAEADTARDSADSIRARPPEIR